MHKLLNMFCVASCSVFLFAPCAVQADPWVVPGRPAMFLTAATSDTQAIDIRASGATTMQLIDAVRSAFGGEKLGSGLTRIVRTPQEAVFPDQRTQLLVVIEGTTARLRSGPRTEFEIVRTAAKHLSQIAGINEVIIDGIGTYSALAQPMQLSAVDPNEADVNTASLIRN